MKQKGHSVKPRKTAEERFDEIEAFLNDYREQYGTAPSMQTIGDAVGLCKATVFHYLTLMEQAGRLERRGSKGYITRESTKGMSPILGTIACYALGTGWFMIQSGRSLADSLTLCVLPFLPGDAAKIALASFLAPRLRKAMKM